MRFQQLCCERSKNNEDYNLPIEHLESAWGLCEVTNGVKFIISNWRGEIGESEDDGC